VRSDLPQFMPSSVRTQAIDFDGDGRIDISRSTADAIGSVARFLSKHGWTRGLPVAFGAQTGAEAPEVLGRDHSCDLSLAGRGAPGRDHRRHT